MHSASKLALDLMLSRKMGEMKEAQFYIEEAEKTIRIYNSQVDILRDEIAGIRVDLGITVDNPE